MLKVEEDREAFSVSAISIGGIYIPLDTSDII